MKLLRGKTVLDLTRLLPGGFCSHILSELGARVLKVEEPGIGDYMRSAAPAAFSMINGGKESIGLNLKSEEGKRVLRMLIADSDVFLEGYSPGVMRRLGFSFEKVREINRRIVYCSITSFGQSSPMSSVPLHDLNYQGLSGSLAAECTPSVPLVQYSDLCGGMYACIGILAALAAEKRSAVLVDIPMVQSLMSLMVFPISSHIETKPAPNQGLLFGGSPYYNLYETSDKKYVAVGAIEGRFRENLLKMLGLPVSGAVEEGNKTHDEELKKRFADAFSSRTRDVWVAESSGKGACVSPVLSVAEAVSSVWGGWILDGTNLNTPFHKRGEGSRSLHAPRLGEHTERILKQNGISRSRIVEMMEKGAVS
jgi:crotonobetainyl-CoA:carnitine CoA-transferase CaiB-like acyl-CoA transferase